MCMLRTGDLGTVVGPFKRFQCNGLSRRPEARIPGGGDPRNKRWAGQLQRLSVIFKCWPRMGPPELVLRSVPCAERSLSNLYEPDSPNGYVLVMEWEHDGM